MGTPKVVLAVFGSVAVAGPRSASCVADAQAIFARGMRGRRYPHEVVSAQARKSKVVGRGVGP
jgi:hypothetical protein